MRLYFPPPESYPIEQTAVDQGSKNRRRYPRLFRNVRFLFYFLGQTREVYTVDISYNGAFIQTDVFPPLGSFVILEHYHLKKRNVTLGLVGKIRRIQTPFQSAPAVRGVGVEWVRSYCNQGFLPLKQFLERDLGYQPFDWDTHLTYEEYDRKIVYDFAAGSLAPTAQELHAILGSRRRATNPTVAPVTPGSGAEAGPDASERASLRPTRPAIDVDLATPPAGLRAGFAEDVGARPDATAPDAERLAQADTVPPTTAGPAMADAARTSPGLATPFPAGFADLATPPDLAATVPPTTRPPTTRPPATPPPATPPPAPAAPASAAAAGPSDGAGSDGGLDDLHRLEVKVVFGVGNRMFYGVVRGVNERELLVETSSPQAVKDNARIQVRMPLSAKNYRYMVVIFGRVFAIQDQGDLRSFRLRIESLDEFQNPGGFRFFLQTLSR